MHIVYAKLDELSNVNYFRKLYSNRLRLLTQAYELTAGERKTFTSFYQPKAGFGCSQLTSTLTITKCLLSSAISLELANTGFNATRENK